MPTFQTSLAILINSGRRPNATTNKASVTITTIDVSLPLTLVFSRAPLLHSVRENIHAARSGLISFMELLTYTMESGVVGKNSVLNHACLGRATIILAGPRRLH